MNRKVFYLGNQKVQTVFFTCPGYFGRGFNPLVITEFRPWYEGKAKKSGRYTKRYANGRQKYFFRQHMKRMAEEKASLARYRGI